MEIGKKSVFGAFLVTLVAASMIWAASPMSFLFRPGGTPGFLNNSNFSMKNQFLFSFSTFNGSSFLQNIYLSTFTYKLSPFWNLSVDLGASKFSGLSGLLKKDLNSQLLPLYGFQAEYKKTKNSRLVLNFGNFQNAPPAGSAGPLPGAWPWESAFAVSAGGDILKNNNWSVYYEHSFFDDKLNVSVYYGHTAPPR